MDSRVEYANSVCQSRRRISSQATAHILRVLHENPRRANGNPKPAPTMREATTAAVHTTEKRVCFHAGSFASNATCRAIMTDLGIGKFATKPLWSSCSSESKPNASSASGNLSAIDSASRAQSIPHLKRKKYLQHRHPSSFSSTSLLPGLYETFELGLLER